MRIFSAPQLDSQLRRGLYAGRFDAYSVHVKSRNDIRREITNSILKPSFLSQIKCLICMLHNSDLRECWSSLQKISSKLGIAMETVQNQITLLEKRKLVPMEQQMHVILIRLLSSI